MNGKTGLQQSFEKINDTTGGIAGQVASGLKDAAEAVTTDVIKAPMDALLDLLTGGSHSAGDETGLADGGDKGIEDIAATAGDDPAQQAILAQKMAESREKRENKLRQAREMIASYEQQWQKTKQEEEQRKQTEEQEEEQKKVEIKQLEKQKKQEALAVQQARLAYGGAGEVVKKKG